MRDKFYNVVSPTLIIHSEEDDLTSPKGAREVYQKISSEDKEHIVKKLMNFYYQLCQSQDSINLILKANLDLKCWNLLTERISFVANICNILVDSLYVKLTLKFTGFL